MLQSTSIDQPTIAVRSQDSNLLSWLNDAHLPPASFDLTPGSRLAIYGDDHAKFLSHDNHQQLGKCHAALCIEKPVSISFLDLYRHNVRHVIYRKQLFAPEALKLAILTAGAKNDPAACNDFREFQPAPKFIDTMKCPVISTEDSDTLRQCSNEFFTRHSLSPETIQAVNLCIKEALTNAIFHGFREAGTHNRKYIPETFHGLYDTDAIGVSFHLTADWLAVRVWDNSGSLGPLSVANSLDRHITNQGLMDTRGRGFYLMQNLSQRLVVCIRRRHETSVLMYFSLDPAHADIPRHFELITL